MKHFAVIPLLLLIALTGCQSLPFAEKTAHAGEKGLQVVFYYDETATDRPESVYFNALLDEINKASLKRDQITIHSGNAASLASRYQLNDCPALIVEYNGEDKAKIEGRKNLNEILYQLNKAIVHSQS